MLTWTPNLIGNRRNRKPVTARELLKQVITPEDSTGAGEQMRLGIVVSSIKVMLCVAAAFTCYATIAQLQ